jgi:hypothetical protein
MKLLYDHAWCVLREVYNKHFTVNIISVLIVDPDFYLDKSILFCIVLNMHQVDKSYKRKVFI